MKKEVRLKLSPGGISMPSDTRSLALSVELWHVPCALEALNIVFFCDAKGEF